MILIPKQKYEAVLGKKEEGEEEQEESNPVQLKKTEESDDKFETLIDISVPSRYKERVKRLHHYLKHHAPIDWNDRGEVVIENETISNSHIVDWLRDVIIPNGHPPNGICHFYNFLKKIHIPQSLISNGKRKQIFLSEEKPTIPPKDNVSEENNVTEPTKKLFVKRDINRLFPLKRRRKWLTVKI